MRSFQAWFTNAFELAEGNRTSVPFARRADGHVVGGWQGGRGWQVNAAAINATDTDDYIVGGSGWQLENLIELLDVPNEYFYDAAARRLYLYPNETMATGGGGLNATQFVAAAPVCSRASDRYLSTSYLLR